MLDAVEAIEEASSFTSGSTDDLCQKRLLDGPATLPRREARNLVLRMFKAKCSVPLAIT